MTAEQIAKKWLQAFNDGHLENLLHLYHDQAEHYSPKLKTRMPESEGFIKGKEALRAWWKEAFERLPNLHYQEKTITGNHERVFMEYLRIVPGEQNIQVAEVLEIKNESIIASRVYHG